MKLKRISIIIALILFVSLFASCSKTGVTEASKRFTAKANGVSVIKRAPYTTRLEEGTLAAVADFSIYPEYIIYQSVEGPAGTVQSATIKNIQITQPSKGKINFYDAFAWGIEKESMTKTQNSVTFSFSSMSSATTSYDMQLFFKSDALGIFTLRNYTHIAGTDAEAEQYFDLYTGDNGIKSDDLRFNIKYTLEISVLENGKSAKYNKDMNLTILEGDFLKQSISYNNPILLSNEGPFSS